MLKNVGLFLLNILCIIGVMIGLAMGSKTLTGKTWQDWLGNEDLIQVQQHTQQHINLLENKLSALENQQANLLATESKPLLQAEALAKKQRILWMVIKLQQKFWSGDPYLEEWTLLTSSLPSSTLQEPALQELGKFASTGLMTKDKLRKLLSNVESTPGPATQPDTVPNNIWTYLKSLVKIERVLPGMLHEEALAALDQKQLEVYIAHHPAYEWARAPLQDLNKAPMLVTNFYKVLDPILVSEKS